MAASALATCEVADCALLAAPRRGRARSRQERCKLSRFAPASDPQRACVVFESISLANGIGNLGVGKVLDHSRGHFAHPGTAPSPVLGWVCGIMSGCGGGVLSEFANFVDDPTPHWVVASAVRDGVLLIDDPWVETEIGESWVMTHELPMTGDALDGVVRWGRGYRGVILLHR